MIQQTSLEAFHTLQDSGELDGDELRVLRLIEQHGPITSRELEPLMGKPVHCFSGRITRLQQRGLVRSAGRVKVNGSSMNAWTAVRRE